MKKPAFLTFDVDFTNYVGESHVNEMEKIVPLILQILKRYEIKATWFLRIDQQMKELYGKEDYLFSAYPEIIGALKNDGHEIGWHFHSYIKRKGKWVQNPNEDAVAEEMMHMQPWVKKHQLTHLRMGWAYHTNKTLQTAIDMGMIADYSGFPRPVYQWEKSLRNWEGAPQFPYKPSKTDYRKEGSNLEDTLPIWEVPIQTVPLSLASDTQIGVMRYINPAYHQEAYNDALEVHQGVYLMTICHPYEIFPNGIKHSMLSFDPEVFEENLQNTMQRGWEFAPLFQFTQTLAP